MYIKEFEIRWSDVDANRHLANSAYINFMTHTRMAFLWELGLDHRLMQKLQIGPVVFYEHMYYYREVFPGKPIRVSLEVTGLSADGMFFEFKHNFYDATGQNVAHCEMMGGWMHLKERKLTPLAPDLLAKWEKIEKPESFRELTKSDTRKHAKQPEHLV